MDPVKLAVQDGVATITMANEAGFNAFDPGIIARLAACFEEALAGDAVAIVLTGSGRAFSTGADVKAMARAAATGEGSRWVLEATEALHPLLHRIATCPKPVVAAVNGVAAGGGLGLALACDARIGHPGARFAAGYFALGLSPDGGATWFLPRLIGWQRTRRFFFENQVLDAKTALEWGLLDGLEEEAGLLSMAVEVARRWGTSAPRSREGTKRLLAATLQTDLVTQLELERGLIAAAAGTAEFREGTSAFVEKRRPRFQQSPMQNA